MKTRNQILQFFASILCDAGRTFPCKLVSGPNGSCDDKATLYGEFKTKLLLFWTGGDIGFVDAGYPYCVRTTLMLPLDVKTRNDLYKRLIVATFNVETGNKIYGGAR
jgi:hypothetical protein